MADHVVVYTAIRLHSAIGYIMPQDKLKGREKEIFATRNRKLSKFRVRNGLTTTARRQRSSFLFETSARKRWSSSTKEVVLYEWSIHLLLKEATNKNVMTISRTGKCSLPCELDCWPDRVATGKLELTVYVVPGSDAEAHVEKRFPHKIPKQVRGSLIPRTIDGFLSGLPITFQRGRSAGLDAVFHFTFTGKEERRATVVIRDQTLRVAEGHEGEADLRLTADTEAWLGFLAKERSLLWALLRRKIRISGSPRLLLAFGKCFPS